MGWSEVSWDHNIAMADAKSSQSIVTLPDTINSTTQYNVMPPPGTTICRHPVQQYAATEFDSRAKVSSVIRAGGVYGKFELAQNLRLSLLNRRH
jgi:hypothetical protein